MKSGDKDDGGRYLGIGDVRPRFAEQFHDLIVDDLDDLLSRRNAREDILSDGPLLNVVNELFCHLEIHIGIQEHPPNLPEGLSHILDRDLSLTPELLEYSFEFLA